MILKFFDNSRNYVKDLEVEIDLSFHQKALVTYVLRRRFGLLLMVHCLLLLSLPIAHACLKGA